MSDADAVRALEMQLSAAEQRAKAAETVRAEREARIATLEQDLDRLRADKARLLMALNQSEARV